MFCLRCLTSRIVLQLLSNSRWRPLPGAHKLSELLPGKWSRQKRRSECSFSSPVRHPKCRNNAVIYVSIKTYKYNWVKGKGMKRFGGAPLDTLSTRHPGRFLHSPRRMWRSERPGAPNKTRKLENTPSKLFFFFCTALRWQLDLLLDCKGSFFGQSGGEADGRPFVSAEFRVFSLKASRYKCGELSSDHLGSNMFRKWELKNLSCRHDEALSHLCILLWSFVNTNASV